MSPFKIVYFFMNIFQCKYFVFSRITLDVKCDLNVVDIKNFLSVLHNVYHYTINKNMHLGWFSFACFSFTGMLLKKGFPAVTRSSVRKDLGLVLKMARANKAKCKNGQEHRKLWNSLLAYKRFKFFIKSYCFGTVLTPVFVKSLVKVMAINLC